MRFNNFLKKYLVDFLIVNEFTLINEGDYFVRESPDDIYQVLIFEHRSKKNKEFFFGFSVDMLFIPRTRDFSFNLSPGARDDYFTYTQSNLYTYENDNAALESTGTIKDLITRCIIPWFNKYETLETLIELYKTKEPYITPPDETWFHFDLMFMYLRNGELEKSKLEADLLLRNDFQRPEAKNGINMVLELLKNENPDTKSFFDKIISENKIGLKVGGNG